ncbi:MAG: ATP-binding protein, partial [Myxococcales bacterium]|nr:ATP-binding protein [Myxococcales bacterium]
MAETSPPPQANPGPASPPGPPAAASSASSSSSSSARGPHVSVSASSSGSPGSASSASSSSSSSSGGSGGASVSASVSTHSFQAEVSQVLHLVIHSLYSHKEIFLRELVSNASDALDKLRFRAITEESLYEGDPTLRIRITPDKEKNTLTIEDTGIGMTEEELVRDLGTVARSGSRAFLEQLAQRGQKDARLIGQFGVGFYSAYLVADRVEVVSRAAGAGQKAHRWISEGKDTFTIEPAERAERGTAITLHLREDQREFLDEWRLRDLVKRYSEYVSHPIELFTTKGTGADAKTEYEVVNRASALWQRPKAEITDA